MSGESTGEPEPKAKGRGSISESVIALRGEGKSNRDIARKLYDDETKLGQSRVRAILSKLRKSGRLTTTSNSNRSRCNSEEGGAEKEPIGENSPETREPPRDGCAGEGMERNQSATQERNHSPQPVFEETVRAPVAGLGSRVGYVLERDVVTAVLCDVQTAKAIQRLAHRVTGAGFRVMHQDGVTFQSKGDVVSVSEPGGDLERAAAVLKATLGGAGLTVKQIEDAAACVRHPGQIGFDELTVVVDDPEIIEAVRRCEPFIPDAGRGVYQIRAPSPLMPGLKIYLSQPSRLRIELVAHNEKQAYNAFFIRAEFVGDVLSAMKSVRAREGAFDEWRARYWYPYSHPIVINLDVGSIVKPVSRRKNTPSQESIVFDDLPPELRQTIDALRRRGVAYYNDFRVILSDDFKKAFRRNPSKIMQQLEFVDSYEKEVMALLLQKTAVDYATLLERIRGTRTRAEII